MQAKATKKKGLKTNIEWLFNLVAWQVCVYILSAQLV